MAAPQPVAQDYAQPPLPSTKSGWAINSIDLQVLTKSDGWNQGQTERLAEYQEIIANGGFPQYVALAVPYDNLTKYTGYVADARSKGFKVYHRSHWNAWQGDNNVGNIATSTSLTSSGTTATCVTSTPHLLNTGDTVSMNGMNETTYRGEFVVTVTNSTTFTYTLPTTAASPATGSIGWRFGRQTYLDHTYDFIVNNSSLFQAGDMFGMCVEADQADAQSMTFKTPGTTTFNTAVYNQFQKDQVRYANAAFAAIGLTHLVHTWPISHNVSNLNLNGQTVNVGGSTSTGNSSGLGDSDIQTYFAGRLSLDHYEDASVIDGNTYKTDYGSDLDKFALAFPSIKQAGGGLMLSEWGFHTQTDYGDGVQYGVYDSVVTQVQNRNFVIGVNFWNHLGQLQSSLWKDNSGTIIPGGRAAVNAVKRAFTTGNATFGRRVRV